MAKLDSNPTLSVHLEENRPFVYAHLVKFERPLKEWTDPNATVLYSEKYSRYVHITDASYAINFDDKSKYYAGQTLTDNPTQTYYPNKLVNVSSVQDSAESKVATFNITLAADAIDAALYSQTVVFTTSGSDYFLEATDSFSAVGFSEGDLLYLNSSDSGINSFKKCRIVAFSNGGKKIKVSEETIPFVDATVSPAIAWVESGKTYDITQSSTELTAVTLDQKSANFINRQVSIYKAFFYEDEPDVFIGSPVLLFSGIVASANFKEDPQKGATISWVCKSHWGDFQQVKGRMGSDEIHRALDSNGNPQPLVTVRPEYAQDLGFQHANNAVNIIGLYTTVETRMVEKWRNKLFGTKKYVEEEYDVLNEVDLRFNLAAKYIPVVYGVRRLGGTSFFADTNTTASKLYIAETLAEGPIQSILNVYVEDQPLVCISEQDSDVRGNISDAVDVVCYGRADKGQVLLGTPSIGSTFNTSNGYLQNAQLAYEDEERVLIEQSLAGAEEAANALTGKGYGKSGTAWNVPNLYSTVEEGARGITHNRGIKLSSPGDIRLEFKAGLSDQLASSSFATIGNATGFKLQADYFGASSGSQYWGGEHRVLDTAYVTSEFGISSEQTSAPSIEYVIKGKMVESYNYDGSFGHIGSGESESNFSLGDTVTIKNIGGTTLALNVTIIDKWYYFDSEANQNYRFRWSLTSAQEELLLDAKSFYMEKGTDTWTMATYDYKEGNVVFSVEKTLKDEVDTVESTATSDATVTTTLGILSQADLGGGSAMSLGLEANLNIALDGVSSSIPSTMSSTVSITTTATESGTEITLPNVSTNDLSTVVASSDVTTYVYVMNKIKLATNSNLSAVTDYYVGKTVVLVKVDNNGNKVEITKSITGYEPTERVLTITPDFIQSEIPGPSDTVSILGTAEGRDVRPTNNFALMLLDYLQSKRYGAGLGLDSKINKNSFLQSARTCDTRSDITIKANSAGVSLGEIFTYSPSSVFKWRGTVKSLTSTTITFGDCIGKLTHKFSKIRQREINDIVWDDNAAQTSLITSPGLQTSISSNASSITTFSLTGPSTITVNATAGVNPVSYSLYDSDFVTYWKYVGWDSPDQRWVTRHQGNIIIDTAQPVFNVIGSLLDHFNGILSFEDGKFTLSVETRKDADRDLWWNFLDSQEGWAATGGTLTASTESAALTGGASLDKTGLSFDGSTNLVVRARIKKTNAATWVGRVYYSTDDHVFNASYYKDITEPEATNEWGIVSWNMSDLTVGGTDWEDNFITGIRLDLGPAFDVEWISVGSGVRVIENEDIVGTISIKDGGLSKSYNSLSASIVDPANNFNTRSVSFFNSEFLKQDRGVVRSGSYKLEGITNYHNARLAVEQTLNRSRFSRQVSFTVRPVGLALSPGSLIRVKYPRFGWDTGKYFRIQSMTYQVDCMVNIVATEHDDSIYFIQAPKASPYSIERTGEALDRTPEAPSALVATNDNDSPTTEILDGIELTWDKAASLVSSADYEIWRSVNSDFSDSVKIATVPYNSEARYLDKLQPTTRTSYYYKIRTAQTTRVQTTSKLDSKIYYSAYIPSTAVEGTTQAKFNNYIIPLYQKTTTNVAPTKPSNTLTYTFSTNSLSDIPDNGWSTTLPNNSDKYSWRIEQPVSSITDTVEISTWNDPSLFAEQGADAQVIKLVPSASVINYSTAGTESDTIVFTTETQGMPAGINYRWLVGTTQKEYDTNSGFTLAQADEPAIGSFTKVTVEARTGGSPGTLVATDSVTIYAIQDGSDALTLILSNEAHTLAVTSGGTVTYTGSGTTISLFEGTTPLDYDGTGTTNGHWTVTAAATNITAGAISESTNDAVVADHSAMTATSAYITYTITGKRLDGTAISLTKTQSFGQSIEGATPVKGVDYDDGDPGLRSIQGYLYYEKTTANAPSAPTGNTYTFSTGVVTGTGIGTGVNTWTNEPRPQDPTSSNTHYTLRYYGTEAPASSTTIDVTYSSVVQYTNFTGVVTFSNGTFSDGPTAIDGTSDATSINGGSIKTNSITATQIAADTITASELEISNLAANPTGTEDGIFLDGTNNNIKIFANGVLRVKIGSLS